MMIPDDYPMSVWDKVSKASHARYCDLDPLSSLLRAVCKSSLKGTHSLVVVEEVAICEEEDRIFGT